LLHFLLDVRCAVGNADDACLVFSSLILVSFLPLGIWLFGKPQEEFFYMI
jgi:hypothetical protein